MILAMEKPPFFPAVFSAKVKFVDLFVDLERETFDKMRRKIQKTAENKSFSADFLVGVPGFEPGASWTRTKRDTKLRHTPMQLAYLLYFLF